jgi:predicted nucleotidyltransferase
MGISKSLADALFSKTQQGVLGLLFGQPDRSFYATEIISRVGVGSGAVQRELQRLEQSGLVTVSRVGTQKHFVANPSSPLFAELCSIAQKTVGLAEPVRRALAPFASRIQAAFIFGSVAKRSDTAASDIDLLILSKDLAYADIYPSIEPVERHLGRPLNPTIVPPDEWARRLQQGQSFATRVMAQPKIMIYGSDDAFAA